MIITSVEPLTRHYRLLRRGRTWKPVLRGGELPVVLSYGAGVDSFDALRRLATDPSWGNLARRLAGIVHSALGAEWPETDAHLYEHAIPYAQAAGWDITIIQPQVRATDGAVCGTIYDYYWHQAAIPTRQRHSCSDRFKRIPCQEATEDLVGKALTIIGYDADEGARVERLTPSARADKLFPLYEFGVTRAASVAGIEADRLPVPPKSACTFCMYSKVREMADLCHRHPEIMDRNVALEEHMQETRHRPDITILHRSMRSLRDRFTPTKAS